MTEFQKGSSKPQGEETLERQTQKRITTDLTYLKLGVTLEVLKLEGAVIFEKPQKGDFTIEKEKWNYKFGGNAQFTVGRQTDTMNFTGYAKVKNDKCESVYKTITIEN